MKITTKNMKTGGFSFVGDQEVAIRTFVVNHFLQE